ncbi:MAG TPA: Imm70 family immunity protein [Polyangia bacterium]
MSIAIHVAEDAHEIGSPSFFKSFFSTIVTHLEHGQLGARFPAVMRNLYSGAIAPDAAATALEELRQIRTELARFPPQDVVWDFEDRNARPPWGDRISPQITSLANYYVTSDGKDLFDVLIEALSLAVKSGKGAHIQ